MQKSSWTYEDFLTYLMLYAANADLVINEEEKEMLFTKVSLEDYGHVHKIFEKENDYERLQTIKSFKDSYYNTTQAQEKLLRDLKDMFMADEEYNSIENAFFMGLKKVLK